MDLVFLDIKIPEQSGIDLLKCIKAKDPGIPVIMISMVDDKEMGVALGAADYLSKPFDRERLVGLLLVEVAPGVDQHQPVVRLEAGYVGEGAVEHASLGDLLQVAGAYAYSVINWQQEYFAVSSLTCPGFSYDGVQRSAHIFVEDHDFDFYLGQELHLIFPGSPLQGNTSLATPATHFC